MNKLDIFVGELLDSKIVSVVLVGMALLSVINYFIEIISFEILIIFGIIASIPTAALIYLFIKRSLAHRKKIKKKSDENILDDCWDDLN